MENTTKALLEYAAWVKVPDEERHSRRITLNRVEFLRPLFAKHSLQHIDGCPSPATRCGRAENRPALGVCETVSCLLPKPPDKLLEFELGHESSVHTFESA